jgi:predicted DNA-binding transcriptional regulator AlpA
MVTAVIPPPNSPHKTPRRRRIPPGLLRRAAAARYCGAGVSTWDRWTAAGLTPAPIRISGAVLWSRQELAAWCRHGCPPRAEWEPLWREVIRRASK